MIKRLIKTVKYVVFMYFGIIAFFPVGLYWIVTGDERPFNWFERVYEKYIR